MSPGDAAAPRAAPPTVRLGRDLPGPGHQVAAALAAGQQLLVRVPAPRQPAGARLGLGDVLGLLQPVHRRLALGPARQRLLHVPEDAPGLGLGLGLGLLLPEEVVSLGRQLLHQVVE